MAKTLLLLIWATLIFILFFAINVYALMKIFERPPIVKKPVKPIPPDMPMDEMKKIAESKASVDADLKRVFGAIAAHHPIAPKEAGKTPKAAKVFLDLIFTMAGHKNMSHELRTEMYNELSTANPGYAADFQKALGA
ncbi:MAG: hypothetical protein LBU73_07130 [Helicobacteraceae bacterium]|jgi:hypothetical protein|nr:hypothetical protein [Helicobacteraceae bacterium]